MQEEDAHFGTKDDLADPAKPSSQIMAELERF